MDFKVKNKTNNLKYFRKMFLDKFNELNIQIKIDIKKMIFCFVKK